MLEVKVPLQFCFWSVLTFCPSNLISLSSSSFSQQGQWGYCDPNCVQLVETTERPQTNPRVPEVRVPEVRLPDVGVPDVGVPDVSTENYYDGTMLPTHDDQNNNTCGTELTFGSIVGGVEAKIGAYPFIAALGVKNTIKPGKLDIIYICGGSLINRRYVVTAGVQEIDNFSLSMLLWQNVLSVSTD
jgi:hypothetical protein